MPRPKKDTKYTLLYKLTDEGDTFNRYEHHDSLDDAKVAVGAILDNLGASYVDGSMRLVIGPVEEVRFRRETVTTLQIGEPKKRVRKPRAPKPPKLPLAKMAEAK